MDNEENVIRVHTSSSLWKLATSHSGYLCPEMPTRAYSPATVVKQNRARDVRPPCLSLFRLPYIGCPSSGLLSMLSANTNDEHIKDHSFQPRGRLHPPPPQTYIALGRCE